MIEERVTLGAYKTVIRLEKWENGRIPDDGPPNEVVESATWHEADGTEVTDPARVAVLEAKAQGEM